MLLVLVVASCAPPVRDPGPAFTVETGRLFIKGHEIQPPFRFQHDGHILAVNGVVIWNRRPRPAHEDNRDLPAALVEQSRRQQALHHRVSLETRSLQSQRASDEDVLARVEELYRSSPLVDSVVLDVASPQSILVFWKPDTSGPPGVPEYVSWPAARGPLEPYDPVPLVDRIKRTLEEGGVGIVGMGRILCSPASISQSVLHEIAEARQVRSLPQGYRHVPYVMHLQFVHPDPLDSLAGGGLSVPLAQRPRLRYEGRP